MSTTAGVLPHNIEAERIVLGALIIDRQGLDDEISLRDADFFLEPHRRIFEQWTALREDGARGDLTEPLIGNLASAAMLNGVGGAAYIERLSKDAAGASDVKHQLDIVKDRARLRELIYSLTDVLGKAYDAEDLTSHMVIDQAQETILTLGTVRPTGALVAITDLVRDGFELIERFQAQKGVALGVATGFTDLDEMTTGLQPGNLVVIGGRPSTGKTALALNIASNLAASEPDAAVLFFSLEATKQSLFMRLLTAESRIDGHRLRSGFLSTDDYGKLVRAIGYLEGKKLFFDDTRDLSILELRTKARRFRAEHPLKLIIVDDCHRLGRVNVATGSLLKSLAAELDVPVVVLSNLSRAVESRTDHRPRLSDLRDNIELEQYADLVLLIYRRELYEPSVEEISNIAEVIIARHRDGPTGSVTLAFMHQYVRFENVAQGYR